MRGRRSTVDLSQPADGKADGDTAVIERGLVEQAAAGDLAAFDGLYRRHSEAAWRVAHAVCGNPDDASDAVAEAFVRVLQAVQAGRLDDPSRFRPYLLSATRNAAIDGLRRNGRLRPTDVTERLETASASPAGPSDRALDALDLSLVAAAFRSLPERWRSVLWLTEVEGMPARDAASLLGVSANGAAQLAVRARAGLRERFLQAHLKTTVDEECRFTVERLGAYVGGGLAARELAKVDQHLAACAACRDRKEELDDLGSCLRRIALPLPLGLAALALNRWKLAHAVANVARRPVKGLAGALETAQRPLMAMSLGMVSLGIVAAAVVGQRAPTRPTLGRVSAPNTGATPESAAAPITSPPVVSFVNATAAAPVPAASPVTDLVPPTAPLAPIGAIPTEPVAAAPAAPVASAPVVDSGAPASPTPAPTPGPTGPPSSTPAPADPLIQAGADVTAGPLGTAAAVAADPSCTGATTTGVDTGSGSVPGGSAGCTTTPPSSTSTGPVSVTVSTGGTLTGTNTVTVP